MTVTITKKKKKASVSQASKDSIVNIHTLKETILHYVNSYYTENQLSRLHHVQG